MLVPGAAAAVLLLLALGQGLTFYHDERAYVAGLQVADLLRPHNEHWSAVLVVIYTSLVHVFGGASYLPYHVTLIATHLFAASGVYAVLRRAGTEGYATAATLIFLVLGAGYENLFWAFQIGFVLATGLGLWALAVCDERPALAAVLLTVAVATQGVGLFYLAAVGVRLVGKREALWLLLPVGIYLAWFLGWGAAALGTHDGALGPRALLPLIPYVAWGIVSTVGAIGSGGAALGAVLLLLAAVTVRHWSRWTMAAFAGLVTTFVLTGLVRAQFGIEYAAMPRYLYVAMPFVLLAGADVWNRWRKVWAVRTAAPALVVVAVAMNVLMLVVARGIWDEIMAADPARHGS